MTDASGSSVNAVRGFMDMVRWMIDEREPDEVVAVFDEDWRPAFRVAAYPDYKSKRAEDPPELPGQFEVLAGVLDAVGIRRAEAKGLEADDVIATLVKDVSGEERAVIVSGDRDLISLVRDPNVRLLFPIKGVREMRVFDEAAVRDSYGIPPQLYPELAILRGDPSDGLPGVPGIGPKRAADLLRTYGSIAGIFEHLGDLPVRQRDGFEASRDYLAAMETVVPLVRDADYTITERHPVDEARLAELAERHNLGSSAARLARSLRRKAELDRAAGRV